MTEDEKPFSIAISEEQKEKLNFHIGDVISGTAWTKKYPEFEYADYYRCGAMKKMANSEESDEDIPELSTYSWRVCRTLDTRCWKGKCFSCKWATMANVT